MSGTATLPGCICRTLQRTALACTRRTALPARMGVMDGLQLRYFHQGSRRLQWASHSPALRNIRHTAPRSVLGQQRRNMFVQTETTPNEDSLKFIPGVALSESGQTHEFLSSKDAMKSPLASALFDVPGVRMVFFGPDFLSVNKAEDTQWSTLKPEIYSIIIEHFSQGKALFYEGMADNGPEDTRILDTDSEVVAMVKELLDTRVRPAVMEDGGDLAYEGFDEQTGMVRVSLKGSCRGCSSSSVTLKNGIERMLMHYIPEVKGVEQVISAEEAVAADEFSKFEARLRAEGKTVEI